MPRLSNDRLFLHLRPRSTGNVSIRQDFTLTMCGDSHKLGHDGGGTIRGTGNRVDLPGCLAHNAGGAGRSPLFNWQRERDGSYRRG
jgi:hypothetical protein